MEEKDLQLYIRAVQLARGEDLERLLLSEYEVPHHSHGGGQEGSAREREYDEVGGGWAHDHNAAFYDNYLRTIDA